MSQEPLSDDVDLNAFAQQLAAARPRATVEQRDQLLYAAAFRAGQAQQTRRVRRWQASAALLAVAALGLGIGSVGLPPAEPRAAQQRPVEPPILVRAPDVADEPPREVLSASARWQTLLAKAEIGTADGQMGALQPPTASIWSVGSVARLAGLID